MLEGDAEEMAGKIVEVLRERELWWADGRRPRLRESPVNERMLAFARPLAAAAGGELVALVAGGESAGGEGLTPQTWCWRYRTRRSRPISRKRTRRCLRPRSGRAVPTSSCSRTPRQGTTSRPRRRAQPIFPSSATASSWDCRTARRRRSAESTGAVPRHRAHAVAGGVCGQHRGPARRASGCRPGEHIQLAPPAELESLKTAFVEAVVPADEGVDLTKAEKIVCVGRGIGGAENVPIAEELAEALGAELGASRPVIDSGWLPKVRQIGKSGAT